MKKKIILIIAGMGLFGNIHAQQIINLRTGVVDSTITDLSTMPIRNVETAFDETTVTYCFNKAVIMEDDLFAGTYWWKIDGFGLEDEEAKPSVLNRIDQFIIPYGSDATITVEECEYRDFCYPLTPARYALIDSGDEYYTLQNVKPIDKNIGVFPATIVEKCDIQTYRGQKILNVRVSPIQYNVNTQTVRAYTKIKYKVTYGSTFNALSRNGTNSFPNISIEYKFLQNTVLNAGGDLKARINTIDTQITRDYLILSVPKYEVAVKFFADWKRTIGFNVHVVQKDNWTATNVKETIQELYNEVPNLYYLLIIGDYEDIPADSLYYNEATDKYYVTDLYYGCMDGDGDYTPDIYRGRIPVNTAAEARTVVDKIIEYERKPVIAADFYRKGVNCAYFQPSKYYKNHEERRFTQTAEDIRNYLQQYQQKEVQRVYYTESNFQPMYWNKRDFSYGEKIPDELLKPNFAWDGNAQNIIDAINTGVFYVLHRDHGMISGWGQPAFDADDIKSLNNENRLPVVFSMNCLTGRFNSGTCFAETFLKKRNGGCVGIYGATAESYSGVNDVLTGGMFDAIWPSPGIRIVMPDQISTGITPEPIYRLGQILDQGLARLKEIYTNDRRIRYTHGIFHCFGDPSMRLYTEMPTAYNNVTYTIGDDSISISLGNDVATISFHDLITDEVISYIASNVTYYTEHPQNVAVSVTGHNKIPFVLYGSLITNIQNETINNPKTYNCNHLRIGSDVTNSKPKGPVVFQSGNISIKAKKVTIKPHTTISSQSEVKITIKK